MKKTTEVRKYRLDMNYKILNSGFRDFSRCLFEIMEEIFKENEKAEN